jgi:6-pyruvoyltetrahydropterin/6-carboxytetrahydropterin synthase
LFFELAVGVVGQAEQATGFVINVVDIDRIVRQNAVPTITEKVREQFREGRHIGFAELAGFLRLCNQKLTGQLGKAVVSDLALQLNPARKLAIDCEDRKMIYFSEKFEFAAMHKLWNTDFSDEKNFEVFGKCANPTGHGHNYIAEITVKAKETDGVDVGSIESIVDESFVELVDHKNLNADVDYFKENIPTVENLAVFAWENLNGKFGEALLHSVTIWETDKTSCTYYG